MTRNEQILALSSNGHRLVPWTPRRSLTDSSRPLISWSEKRLTTNEVSAYVKVYPSADWAIVPEGTVVFDLEQKNGLDGRADFEQCLRDVGSSWDRATEGCAITRTKSGGWHVWYREPSGSQLVGGWHLRPGVECKSRNGTVHVPPSFGYSAIVSLGDPQRLPPLPDSLLRLWLDRPRAATRASDVARAAVGQRRQYLCSCAGKLRSSLDMSAEELYITLLALRDSRCDDSGSFTNDEVRQIATSYARKPANTDDLSREMAELAPLLARSKPHRANQGAQAME